MSAHIRVLMLMVSTLSLSQVVAGQVEPIPFLMTKTDLSIGVDYQRGAVAGTATLHFRNVGARATSRIPLLLNRLMAASAVTDPRGRAIPFEQDVVIFTDDSLRQVNAIVVTLPRSVPRGDSVAITVRYGGRLVGYAETGSIYIKDHVARGFTILREDAFAFPTLGAPSWTVLRSMPREPFAFSAEVTVPSGLVVATGGERIGTRSRDSTTTWIYRSRSVAPVPFLNITIAPYRTLEEGGVRIFFFPEDSAGATVVGRAARGALARYAAWYGPMEKDPQVTVMEIPEGWGSQASITGGIIQTADAFRDRERLYQLYHELSHFWNVADLDRPSPRWNEGFASFLQWRMAAELDGWNDWDGWVGRMEASLRSRCSSSQRCGTTPLARYGDARLTDMSYPVGAVMFWLLYQALGADAFDRTYREFFQRHRLAGATSDDFVKAFATASPRTQRIVSEWFVTTRWYTRMTAGESVNAMLADYVR